MEATKSILRSVIAKIEQTKLNNSQGIVPNYTPRTKDIDLSKYDKLNKLKALLSEGRLNVTQIKEARNIIRKEIPIENQGKYWTYLQSKVIYVNQRDNQITGKKGNKIEDAIKGGTCNISSLAMAMKYLGITVAQLDDKLLASDFNQNDLNNTQYEDKLDYIGQYGLKNYNRFGSSVTDIAILFGLTVQPFKGGYHGKAWYEKNILPQLSTGNGVIMSISGHIVRIQGMNEKGLIIDDPFGKTILRKGMGKAYNYKSDTFNNDNNNKNNSYNDNRFGEKHKAIESNLDNVGEDNVWSWEDLKNHGTYWVRVIEY
jgi:uncharacterized protein YvpB